MKKRFLLFVAFFLVAFPTFVSASTCDTSKIDTNRYQFIRKLTGSSALNQVGEYAESVCCTENGTYTCYVYQAKEQKEEQSGTSSGNVNYCSGLSSTFIFIGHIVRLAKILIPIIIIGFGMLDFFKAVTGSKDDEIKKSLRSLIFRTISGVCIFFLPMIIELIFSWVSGWSTSYEGTYKECFKCIWDVGSCK